MRHQKVISFLFAIAAVSTTPVAIGNPIVQTPDEGAVREVTSGFISAWNRHDMRAFADLFADDADFVNVIGMWWRGREEIRKQHEAIHATRMKDSNLKEIEVAVRFPSPDVAVVHQRWELTGDTGIEGKPLPARRGILIFVLQRDTGAWRIIAAQNTDIVPLPNVPPSR